LGALAGADPASAVAAGQGTMNNVTFGGTDPRSDGPFTFYETQGGGAGASARTDGMDAVHVHMSNTLNTPVEVLETAYPLRVKRYELRPDSGGAGEFRGGLGLRRDIEVRTAASVSLIADRHRHAPYGLAGGEPGKVGQCVLLHGGSADRAETLPPKVVRDLEAGDVVSIRTPGGGGYGDPAARDVEAIERDLRLGTLTVERAREAYGYEAE
jgi:N-methylhydantoinase B